MLYPEIIYQTQLTVLHSNGIGQNVLNYHGKEIPKNPPCYSTVLNHTWYRYDIYSQKKKVQKLSQFLRTLYQIKCLYFYNEKSINDFKTICTVIREKCLTHFSPISDFYTPWKRQKTYGFLKFSGGIDMWHWTKMV